MTNDIVVSYFTYLRRIVLNDLYEMPLTYDRLFKKLYLTDFRYILPLDDNRASDGIDLRYEFARDNNISWIEMSDIFDSKPCSILEMMVALAMRVETQIMSNPDIGDRTSEWFWNMIHNLGLGSMNDKNYNEYYVDTVLNRFLNREYDPDGSGGLFTIPNCTDDLRKVDIWYQMNWYLTSRYSQEVY